MYEVHLGLSSWPKFIQIYSLIFLHLSSLKAGKNTALVPLLTEATIEAMNVVTE